MENALKLISEQRCFDGRQLRFSHRSQVLDCDMVFSLYLPPQAVSTPVPLVTWLSGLTCTDENFVTKAGAQRYAAALGLAILAPDTSPRGEGVPDDEAAAYDLGLGAGFYVNASQAPWVAHYQMYDYVVSELPTLLRNSDLPLDFSRQAIFGHSMGGHGALVIGLRNPQTYAAIGAFAPIVAPGQCPWGTKALTAYLGEDATAWKQWDARELILACNHQTAVPIRIDQGLADQFLDSQLKPQLLLDATPEAYPLHYFAHEGYDHSYFFIASFVGEQLAFLNTHL